jgi:hypothetical protein
MPLFKAGQEVDSWCTKCKMDLLHRIVAVVDGKPVNVECRTCYSVHRYRAPKSAVAASSASSRASSTTSTPRAPSTRRAIPEDHVALVPPDHARVLQYRMTERFTKDQWIAHKNFGIGVVTTELGSDKIEVRFDSGPRVLVHGYTE